MSAAIQELEGCRRDFYSYQPTVEPGLHWHSWWPQIPVLCGLSLQPLIQIGDAIFDMLGQQVSPPEGTVRLLPKGTIMLPLSMAPAKLAAMLRVRCLDEDSREAMDRIERPAYGQLRQTAIAASLRSCLPVVIKLQQQTVPIVHAAPVRMATDYIIALMLKAGEAQSLFRNTAA